MCVCARTCCQLCPSLQPQALEPTRLLCPCNFSGKYTGVSCHFLLQGIFLTQESNPYLLCLLHWQVDSLPPCHLGSPYINYKIKNMREVMLSRKHERGNAE